MPTVSPVTQDAAGRAIFFIVIYLLFSANTFHGQLPTPGPAGTIATPRDALKAAIIRQHHALDVLNETAWGEWRYGVAYDPIGKGHAGGVLNLTGFRPKDEYLWESVWHDVKSKVGGMRERIWMGREEKNLALYTNVTAQLMGEWVRSDIGLGGERGWERPGNHSLNLTAIDSEIAWGWGTWNRNITGMEGAMEFVVKEKDSLEKMMSYGEIGSQSVIREIEGSLKIEDESHGADGWEMNLHGVHWPEQGTMVLTTTSEKFAGIYGLPHLTLSKQHFESSQMLLNRSLGNAIERREKMTWGLPQDPYIGNDDSMVPHCEYIVYAQVHPLALGDIYTSAVPKVGEDLQKDILMLEKELRFPNGAPVIKAPPLTVTLLAFSPDCGFVLESKGPPTYTPDEGKHLQGLKQEIYVQHIKHWALIWGAVLLCQVALLRQQVKEASTPSTISRISLYTVAIMVAADMVVVGALMLLAISAPTVFPAATLTSFGGCISMGLGVRFLIEVYNVQEPERREANRVRDTELATALATFRARREAFLASHRQAVEAANVARAANTTNTANVVITAAGADSIVPTPSTYSIEQGGPNRSVPGSFSDLPIIVPSDQDIDAEIAEDETATSTVVANTLPTTNPVVTPQILQEARAYHRPDAAASYLQFMMGMMIFFFVTISSPSWPTTLRHIYFHMVGLCYFSFWIPQIRRNATRNCRKAFQWRFVLGQSALRLLPWAYFYLRDDNVLFATRNVFGISMLVAWVWIQILVLIAMDILGPRFALPKGWLPEAWDYHPLLREDDVEGGGLPLGLVRAPSSPRLERKKTGDEGTGVKGGDVVMSLDCAICMQKLDVPVLGKDEEHSNAVGVAGLLARRMYMVTPCRHMFHSKCLEGWMKYRLQCPICRENLPPL